LTYELNWSIVSINTKAICFIIIQVWLKIFFGARLACEFNWSVVAPTQKLFALYSLQVKSLINW
jgi:hypothetical protein